MRRFLAVVLTLMLIVGCRSSGNVSTRMVGSAPDVSPLVGVSAGCEYASYFGVITDPNDSLRARGLISISPSDGSIDTLMLNSPLRRIVCMSTSNVAALSALGADSSIVAVSGLKYISDHKIRSRAEAGEVVDIGYDGSLDYETIIRLKPELIVAYMVGDAEPPYLAKLRSLGLHVMIVSDHLEQHPLARAEYVKLFGALTGRLAEANDFFDDVRDRYISLCADSGKVDLCDGQTGVERDTDHTVAGAKPVKVLMNIPYADSWYIPGVDNYMSRLVRDAGGVVLGASEGSASGVISIEEAYRLSLQADVWLCPGYCTSRSQLESIHHLFPHFGPVAKGLPIYNNVSKVNAGGGNDFWESGSMRPDKILEDLKTILSSCRSSNALEFNYFIEL